MNVEALVGHLLIVGGRAVSMPPPGMLAETAPRRAHRAREGDTLFALITPAEHTFAPAAFYEELSQIAADAYFNSGGSATGGLRDALIAIDGHLKGSGSAGYRVNALAVVKRGDELFAARSGRTFAALVQGDALVTFPTDRRDPLIMDLPPLGGDDPPDIQLAHYTTAAGQIMLLADAGLLEVENAALETVISSGSLRETINLLKALSNSQTSAVVIQFVPPDTVDPTGAFFSPGQRTARASARPAPEAPPTPAPTPVAPVAPAAPPPSLPETLPEPAPAAETGSIPAAESVLPEPTPEIPAADRAPGLALPDIQPSKIQPPVAQPAPAAPTPRLEPSALPKQTPPAPEEPTAESGSGLREALGRASDLVTGVSDRVQDTRERGRSAVQRGLYTVRHTVLEGLRLILVGALAVVNGLRALFNFILPQPQEGRQGIPAGLAVGTAVLIPLVIVCMVLGLALTRQGHSDFEEYLEAAKQAHQEAMIRSGGTCSDPSLRPTWSEVRHLADQAAKFRADDPDVRQIKADAQNYLDCFDKVERHALTLLHDFGGNAELVGPVVHGGVDLYTLNRTTSGVYHDTLNENGDGLTARADSPIFERGTPIGSYIVGDVFDIDWLRSGGTVHDNVLIAADLGGLLVSYSPTFFASAQQLIIDGLWQNPVAIAVFESNLYVLDAGANQIWRYVPTPGERRYANAPEEYFIGEGRPNLIGAVDFGISADEGAVYILYEDGSVEKYRRTLDGVAVLQPFEYSERPEGAISAGVALFVDNDPASRNLYIVDSDNESIYETSWAGTFRRSYRPLNDTNAFKQVSGFFADSVVRNNMYVVAGGKLYHFHRSE